MNAQSGFLLVFDILAALLWLCLHLERYSDVSAGRKLSRKTDGHIFSLCIYFFIWRTNIWPLIAFGIISSALCPHDPETGQQIDEYTQRHYEEPEPDPHWIVFWGSRLLAVIAGLAIRQFVESGGLTALLDLSA